MFASMVARVSKKSRPHAGAGVPWRGPSRFPGARRSYVYGSYVDELLAILPASGVVGDRKFVHANHLYSVAALTDNSGNVVERYRYDAYGQRIVLAGDGVTLRWGSSYGNQVGYTGRYLDKETGLWYFRNRMLSSSMGRFIGRNQFGSPVGWKFTVSPGDHLNVELINLRSAYSASVYIEGMSLYLSNLGLQQTVDPSGEPPPGFIPGPNGGGWNTTTGEYVPPSAEDLERLKEHLERNKYNQCPSVEPSGGAADSKGRTWKRDSRSGERLFHCCYACYRHCNFQCCYDKGKLVTSGGCEGTFDFSAHNPDPGCPPNPGSGSHFWDDVAPHISNGNYVPNTTTVY